VGKRAKQKPKAGSRAKSPKLWFFVCLGLLVVLIAVVVAVVVNDAMKAKNELQAAVPLAETAQKQLMAGDMKAARATGEQLEAHTHKAAAESSGMLWRGMEWVPFVGHNLAVVRELSATVDDLATNALVPATHISMSSFAIKDGRVDIDSIRDMVGVVDKATASVVKADKTVSGVDTHGLIDPVKDGVAKLKAPLAKAAGTVKAVDAAVKVLPGALGGDGERNYLLLFQNNAESRATGGNPGTFALLNADDGKIKITQTASGSSDFTNGPNRPMVAKINPQTEHIYGKIIGQWTSNITQTPNFPTTAKLAEAYWEEYKPGTKIDGVLSIDPVALSYMLKGTGPVKLASGDTVTSKNAVSLLMNKIYFRSSDYRVLDAFFGSAAESMFNALASGKGDPKVTLEGIVKAANEGRILYWSNHKSERTVIDGMRLAGTLPASNAKDTVIGTYLNDVTGAKMDYYLKMKVKASSDQCTVADDKAPTFKVTVTLHNDVKLPEAPYLPSYITGPWYKAGSIGTDVVVYSPVGAKITSWKVDGVHQDAVTTGPDLDRNVVRLKVKNTPGQTVTLTYTITGKAGADYGPLSVRTTPMTGDTPVTLDTPGCD